MDKATQGRTAGQEPTPTRCENKSCWLDEPEATSVCRICKTDKKTPFVPVVRA